MKKSDFNYELPEALIAQHPVNPRSASRLLHLASDGVLDDRSMVELPKLLRPGDLLVFNDTRVIPARLHGQKPTGGRVEILIERLLDSKDALAQLGVSKTPKAGTDIVLDHGGTHVQVVGREGEFFRLRLGQGADWMSLLEAAGRLPLPPYIHHAPDAEDRERYQTIFARAPGAVAAPTAGLHFDDLLLEALREAGVQTATVTLHVGAGTFQPLRVDDLREHRMHAERWWLPAELPDRIAATRAAGGRVVAVGTTVVRTLESAWEGESLRAGSGETRLFITPGYRFRAVDALLTNFHLPESTLLMLVSAFAGYERMMAAYRHAVAQRYRFFSYGDAMLIEPAR
jgi:S-adenosylmethionine:tRNA ribosyltransferase-isomerase